MRLLGRLAIADLWGERTLALCTVLAIAAVLAPLLILAGLRDGVIAGLRARLLANPASREIISVGNREFSGHQLAALARRADVSFLAPRFRTLAMSLNAERSDGRGGAVLLEIVPSAPGDPLLGSRGPSGTRAVVLSAAAAARLSATAGSKLLLVIARIERGGARQAVRLPVTVQGVAPAWAFTRPAAFVATDLAAYVEHYQDGMVGPIHGGALPAPQARRRYAGFRLFARRLRDVPALAGALERQGLEVASHQREVAALLGLNRDLGLLFTFVAGLGGVGYLLALGASLWAAVDRKRRPFGMLRFLGLPGPALAAMPSLEALLLGAAGVAVALVSAEIVALAIDHTFTSVMPGQTLCVINADTAVRALAATLAGAAIAAAAAGWRLARIEPWEEMR